MENFLVLVSGGKAQGLVEGTWGSGRQQMGAFEAGEFNGELLTRKGLGEESKLTGHRPPTAQRWARCAPQIHGSSPSFYHLVQSNPDNTPGGQDHFSFTDEAQRGGVT